VRRAAPSVAAETPARPVTRVVAPPIERPVVRREEAARQDTRGTIERDVDRLASELARAAETEQRANAEEERAARMRILELMSVQRQAGATVDVQLEQLARQLEMLRQQLRQIEDHQEQLAAAQRALSNQAESMRRLSEDVERLRRTLDAR
jgi:hypothetical protein